MDSILWCVKTMWNSNSTVQPLSFPASSMATFCCSSTAKSCHIHRVAGMAWNIHDLVLYRDSAHPWSSTPAQDSCVNLPQICSSRDKCDGPAYTWPHCTVDPPYWWILLKICLLAKICHPRSKFMVFLLSIVFIHRVINNSSYWTCIFTAEDKQGDTLPLVSSLI
jgi:hypothetical protein